MAIIKFTAGNNIFISESGNPEKFHRCTAGTEYTVESSTCLIAGKSGSTPVYGILGDFVSIDDGDIRSLIDTDDLTVVPVDSQFYGAETGLFEGNTSLTDASGLILTDLTPKASICRDMFKGCTALTNAPDLPTNDILAESCYESMFEGTALVEMPDLPSENLARACYKKMFAECRELEIKDDSKTPPSPTQELPATELKESCYEGMFKDATKTKFAPILPAIELGSAANCYKEMFMNTDPENHPSALNYIKTSAMDIDEGDAYSKDWVTGVNTKQIVGDFWEASSAAGWIQPSNDAIPEGWTVHSPACLEFTFENATDTLTCQETQGALLYSRTSTAGSWTTWGGQAIEAGAGLKIYIQGNADDLPVYGFSGNFVKVAGDVMSLIKADHIDQAILHENQFTNGASVGLFSNCTALVDAKRLSMPAVVLAKNCYANMFSGCTSLTTLPKLRAGDPARVVPGNLAESCYNSMFKGCTAITAAPVLPATTLAEGCYRYMFEGCTSLTNAELPATTLAEGCYSHMFSGCTSITTSFTLPATTLADYCYESMFEGCTSITNFSDLPATTLTNYCYFSMFKGCTAVTTSPLLKATTLYPGSYREMFKDCTGITSQGALRVTTFIGERSCESMFEGCTSLTSNRIPQSATTLANLCYKSMYKGCTSLASTQPLPALTLAEGCYEGMFEGCEALTTIPTLKATTLVNSCYKEMFKGCKALTDLSSKEISIKNVSGEPIGVAAEESCFGMFEECEGITAAPSINIKTLDKWCYDSMFKGCKALTITPALPVLTLANYCYQCMFEGCEALTTTPPLPAGGKDSGGVVQGALADGCYSQMFKNCTGITSVPLTTLPALTLVQACYTYMFDGCTALKEVHCPATSITGGSTSCTGNWLNNTFPATTTDRGSFCGVMSLDPLKTTDPHWELDSVNGVPVNWTYYITAGENLWISIDGNPEKFSRCIPNQTYTVTSKCLLAGKGTQSIYGIEGDFNKVTGDVLTLIDCDNPSSAHLIESQFFNGTDMGLFNGPNCSAFEDASNIELKPMSIPASAYRSMFKSCPIRKAPELPADVVGVSAYADMFNGCSTLIEAPTSLPAMLLPEGAYQNMFKGCSCITTAPSLQYLAAAGKNSCSSMFEDCTDLTDAPILPASSVSEACYKGMFKNCNSLVTAPIGLYAPTLAKDCYKEMFMNTNISEGPALSASTLAESCYEGMFYYCTSLERGPASLPAETLVDNCYKNMFYRCTHLKGPISIAATTAPSPDLTENMFTDSGLTHVASERNINSIINVSANRLDWVDPDNAGIDVAHWYVPLNAIILTGNSTEFVSFQFAGGANIEVSDTGETWTPLAARTSKSVSNGTLYVRGKTGSTPLYRFSGEFSKVSGNIMSLVDYENPDTASLSPYQFYTYDSSYDWTGLFDGCISLKDASDLKLPNDELAHHCYAMMFRGCTALTQAPAFPATTLAANCYSNTFEGCTALTTAPALPATTLTANCYRSMFYNCHALTQAPSLPATSLVEGCYVYMFNSCTSLSGPVNISATSPFYTGTTSACDRMFTNAGIWHSVREHIGEDCVKINLPTGANAAAWRAAASINPAHWEVPLENCIALMGETSTFTSFSFLGGANIEVSSNGVAWTSLAAGTSTSVSNGILYVRGKTGSTPVYGFAGAFNYVDGKVMSLVDYENPSTASISPYQFYGHVPELGYPGFFTYNCTSLVDASQLILPSTTASSCYNAFFRWCTSLKYAPQLPATVITDYCYYNMFERCTSLIQAPSLPATSLVEGCYVYMFNNCTNLAGPVNISATSPFYTGTTSACTYMFNNTGLSHHMSTHAGEDCVKINLPTGANTAAWRAAAGINPAYWEVPIDNCIALTGDSAFVSFQYTAGANIEVSSNGVAWTSLAAGTSTSVSNSTLYVRGKTGATPLYGFAGAFNYVDGNIMSLVDYENTNTVALNPHQFHGNDTGIFSNCTQLVYAQQLELPRTTLALSCYACMFKNSTNLITAPRALPAATLTEYCYYQMFLGCSSLLNVATNYLHATTLGDYCYKQMFENCSSFNTTLTLPATALTVHCYYRMFCACTSLQSVPPSLPATTLSDSCYAEMFLGCSSITSVPLNYLSATNLSFACYSAMFYGCTSLTSAPSLPATTLTGACYQYMFYGCTSLTSAPKLPASTLLMSSYQYMFYNCTKLTGPVHISATSPYYSGTATACGSMFYNSGTSRPSTPTDYNKIYVGGSASAWYEAASINSAYWQVQ